MNISAGNCHGNSSSALSKSVLTWFSKRIDSVLFVVLHSLSEHKKSVPLKGKAIENIQNKALG
jgi:hypothetical protein